MSVATKPMFVAIEGIDCSGKTTQANILSAKLDLLRLPTVVTRSLSSDLSVCVRRYITTPDANGVAKALLFAADRLIRYRSEVEPSLSKGINVIADRWILSSLAYQSLEGVPLQFVRAVNKYVIDTDMSIIIDISAEEAEHRAKTANRSEPDRSRLELLRNAYHRFSDRKNVVIVDGTHNELVVANKIFELLATKFELDISM